MLHGGGPRRIRPVELRAQRRGRCRGSSASSCPTCGLAARPRASTQPGPVRRPGIDDARPARHARPRAGPPRRQFARGACAAHGARAAGARRAPRADGAGRHRYPQNPRRRASSACSATARARPSRAARLHLRRPGVRRHPHRRAVLRERFGRASIRRGDRPPAAAKDLEGLQAARLPARPALAGPRHADAGAVGHRRPRQPRRPGRSRRS